MKIAWIALCFALLPMGSQAHHSVSLQEALALAEGADPRIKEREYLAEAAKKYVEEIKGKKGWMVDATAVAAMTKGVDGGLFENGTNACGDNCSLRDDLFSFADGLSPWLYMQFAIIKPLYTFGKVENFEVAASKKAEVEAEEVNLQKSRTRMQVAKAYYGYLTARESRLLLEDVEKQIVKAEETIDAGLEEGTARLADKFALKAGKALLARYMAEAVAIEKIALSGLKVLTGKGLKGKLAVKSTKLPMVRFPRGGVDSIIEYAMMNRPEMRQVNAGIEAMHAYVAGKKSMDTPNLFAGVGGTISYAPNRDRLDNPHIYDPFNHVAATPMIGLQWSWQEEEVTAAAEKADLELNALLMKAEFAKLGIPFQVTEAYETAKYLKKAAVKMKDASKEARRAVVANFSDVEAAAVDASELVESFKVYVLLYAEYLKTLNDYNVAVFNLREVAGGYTR